MTSSPLPPSIKGAALRPLAAAVNALVDSGKLAVTELDAALGPDEVTMLESEIAAGLWYPVASFDQMGLLLCRQAGSADPAWIAGFCREHAESLLADGPYGSFVERRRRLGVRAGTALVKLSELLLSFGEWSYAGDPRHGFLLEVRDAAPMSELLQHAAGGFVTHIAAAMMERPIEVSSERPAPDRVLYRGRPA